MRTLLILTLLLCTGELLSKKLKEGVYRGVLILNEQNNTQLPFNFTVTYKNGKPLITIRNADERIVIDEITVRKDSVNFNMPVFDTEFKTVITKTGLQGVWINHYRKEKNVIRFIATFGEEKRFLFVPGKTNPVFEGRWEVTFSPGTSDSSKAIGIFNHVEMTDYITGTFLTETGDYRYLEGMKHGGQLYLSCFDGSRAYLFTAEHNGSEIVNGIFYSGSHFTEPWIARPNNSFRLADANTISFMEDKSTVVDFTFKNTKGFNISLSDKSYQNKPVIIQIMGSWCANCMDESRYLTDLYKRYRSQGLEIIGLAFEKTTDFNKAAELVERMKNRLKIEYEVLVTAQTGKEKAGEAIKGVNAITSFPTTVFLNRKHHVERIHSGFSGPATGAEYDKFIQETETLVDKLLTE
jgi:thiol-disulfide isomerase/thioredoxin